MAVLSATTKARLGMKSAKGLAKHPKAVRTGAKAARPLAMAGLKAAKPIVRLKVRRRAEEIGETARLIGEAVLVYGPVAAQELGLVEPPKEKRTAPRVAAGMVVGAGAMYLLEPGQGREHREKLLRLVS